jgi:hypothetical protein
LSPHCFKPLLSESCVMMCASTSGSDC